MGGRGAQRSAHAPSPTPITCFGLFKWLRERDNHFNLVEMDHTRVNQREVMGMLINSLSSWSDSVSDLKAHSLLDAFLRFDCL